MSEPELATEKDWFAEDTLRRAGVSRHPTAEPRGQAKRRRQAESVARREEGLRRSAEEAARRRADKERGPSVPPFWPPNGTPTPGAPSGRTPAQERRRLRWAVPIAACFAAGVAILVAGGTYWLEQTQPVEAFPPSAVGDLDAGSASVTSRDAAVPAEEMPTAGAPPSDAPNSLEAPRALAAEALPDPRARADALSLAAALRAAKTPPDPAAAGSDAAPEQAGVGENARQRSASDQAVKIAARPTGEPSAAVAPASKRLSGRELRALVPGAVTRGTNALGHEFVYRFKANGTVEASTFVSANAKSSADLVETSVPWRIVGDTLCVSFAAAPGTPRTCHQVRREGPWYEALFADGTSSAKFTIGEN